MKIAIVSDAWHPQVNGVVTTLTKTIAKLESWSHRVLAVTPALFQTLPCPSYPEISLALAPYRKTAWLLDEFNPHSVHVATEGPLGWAARRYCLRRKLNFTTSYHTRFPEYIRLRVPIPLSWSYAVVRSFHKAAAATMVASEHLAAELTGHGFRNLKIWSRGVDTEFFRPGDKNFLAAPRPIYLYAGRVAVEKNIEDFLRLPLSGSKFVIGDGPDLARLRNKYTDVFFPGYKRGWELAAYMTAADVFVFPSRTDTFGLVMLEAMACGVPVAAYPVSGPAGLVRNGENGVLNQDLARAALAALAVDPQACRDFARRFSWKVCTRQFLGNLAPLSLNCSPEAWKELVA